MMKLALFVKTAIKSLLEGLPHSSEGKIWKDIAEDCPPLCIRYIHHIYTHTHRSPQAPSPLAHLFLTSLLATYSPPRKQQYWLLKLIYTHSLHDRMFLI